MRGQRKNPRKAVQPFENKKRKIDIFKNYEANGVEKIQRKLEIFSTLISKKSNPELKRSYKAPLIMIGAPISALIYLYMMTELSNEAFYTGVIWCLLGIAIYWCCSKYYGSGTSFKLEEKESGVDETPSPEEKRAMDREYYVWWFIVGALSIIATLLYLVPYLAR